MDYGKLKTYYESIDGVTVPFVYPQYWDKDKEEWVVVDKDNRLPVDARLTGSKVEELKQSILLTKGLNYPIYASGTQYISFFKSIKGKGENEFLDDCIYMVASPRGSGTDRQSVATKEKIDLTNIDVINIDWQKEGATTQSTWIRLDITNDNHSFTTGLIARVEEYSNGRKTSTLDVSDLHGKYHLRISVLYDSPSTSDVTLRVFSVLGGRNYD